MKSFYQTRLCLTVSATIIILLLCFPVSAQLTAPNIERLFGDATQLSKAESIEARAKASELFEQAARWYGVTGDRAKAVEAQLENGRVLQSIAVTEMNAGRYDEAVERFERALTKFQAIGNRLEAAFVYHNLGFLWDRRGKTANAIGFYNSALEGYRAAADKNGEANVLRNLGQIALSEKRSENAFDLFMMALKIRISTGETALQAQLYLDLGNVYQSTAKNSDAFAEYNKALGLYRLAKDRAGEATSLSRLGDLQATLFKYTEALAYLESALRIYEADKHYTGEAEIANQIGRVLMSNGKHALAEPYLIRAADTFMILNNANAEGSAALDLAVDYQSLSRLGEAQTAVQRALAKFREMKNPVGEAYALLVSADFEAFLNQHDDALAKIRAAEKIFKANNNTNSEYRIARSLANHYHSLSTHGEAARFGQIALDIAIREKDLARQASAYVDLANTYFALGQTEKSLDYTKKALAIARETGSRYLESICLSNLGYDSLKLEKYDEAKPYFEKAIEIMKAEGYEREEGYATHNLGLLYYAKREYPRALTSYNRAYAIYRKTGDRRPESFVHDSFGELYRDLGQYDKALEHLQKAIVLAREVHYNEIEAQALSNMMTLWTRRLQPRLAILYGKQAVNVYQSIRAENRTLDTDSQKSLLQSNEKTYRQLSNILIEEGRLAEAQEVLDLLKAEEYFDFVRRDAAEAEAHAALALSETERNALQEYARVSNQLTSLGTSFQVLQDKRNRAGGKLSEADEAEYVRLKTQVEAAGEGLRTFFIKLASQFSKKVEDGTVVTPQSIETLKADLRRAGPDVVLVSTYLLPERYRAIVTTGRAMVDRKVDYATIKLTGADVNRKIFEFQRALQNPNVDTRKLGKELYDIFVKPLEGDLRGARAKTILWSLDGTLRYIPMAALSPDGRTYLAQHYQNVIVTLGRQTNLFVRPGSDEWRAIGAGVSKPHSGFSALPSVPAEIGAIVRDNGAATGVLDGTRLLDEQFVLESLRNTVAQTTDDGKPFNVLHLATHFSLGASDQDSALLLGDGTRLSLFEIGRDEALDFKDVELLTLSACQTGVSTGDADGREVESLGMLAQKKGAKAVLATLWKVADESTSLFMAEFYRIKKAKPAMNKAEAIRLAQKAMIDGKLKSSGTSNSCRAEGFSSGPKKDEFKCDPNAPFSHPYFWSPFVLIGNWR